MHILTNEIFSFLQSIICINITQMGSLLKCELSGGSAVANKSLKVPRFPLFDYFNKPSTTAGV